MNKHAESSINHSAFIRGASVAFHLEDGDLIAVIKPRFITVSFADRAAKIIGNQELWYTIEVVERIGMRLYPVRLTLTREGFNIGVIGRS